MLQLKNKIIAFVFLLVMAAPVFLSVQFIFEQNIIEQEVEEKMETQVLTTVTISAKHIVWVKKNKEILLDGRLFDIKSGKIENSQAIFVGYFDDKETELVENYGKTVDESNSNPSGRLALKFLLFPYINDLAAIVYEATWQYVSSRYYSFTSVLPVPPNASLTQPPEL